MSKYWIDIQVFIKSRHVNELPGNNSLVLLRLSQTQTELKNSALDVMSRVPCDGSEAPCSFMLTNAQILKSAPLIKASNLKRYYY